jgi:hypothetical protein
VNLKEYREKEAMLSLAQNRLAVLLNTTDTTNRHQVDTLANAIESVQSWTRFIDNAWNALTPSQQNKVA